MLRPDCKEPAVAVLGLEDGHRSSSLIPAVGFGTHQHKPLFHNIYTLQGYAILPFLSFTRQRTPSTSPSLSWHQRLRQRPHQRKQQQQQYISHQHLSPFSEAPPRVENGGTGNVQIPLWVWLSERTPPPGAPNTVAKFRQSAADFSHLAGRHRRLGVE